MEWAPPCGEFEDGTHANLVIWEELELESLQKLKQNQRAAAESVYDRLR